MAVCAPATAGLRGGGAPAHVVLVARVAYGLGFLAQKIEQAVVVLTKGSWWPELLCRVDVGEVRAAGRGGARGEGCWRSALGLLMPQRGPCRPVKVVQGSVKHRSRRRREISAAHRVTCDGATGKIRRAQASES